VARLKAEQRVLGQTRELVKRWDKDAMVGMGRVGAEDGGEGGRSADNPILLRRSALPNNQIVGNGGRDVIAPP